jgi:hypothetical protein
MRGFSVTWSTAAMEASRLLHRLARANVITPETADTCMKLVPRLVPDPRNHLLVEVDLRLDRRTILEQTTWYIDYFLDHRKHNPPRKKGGRPPFVRRGLEEHERDELRLRLERLQRAWPEVQGASDGAGLKVVLTSALWPPADGEQATFQAAGVMTTWSPIHLPPSDQFLAALDTVIPDLLAHRIRRPETCLDRIWADLNGVSPRAIRNLYRKKPPLKLR